LPEELEVDFSSSLLSLFGRVLVDGLTGWLPPSSLYLSRPRQRLLSLKLLLGPDSIGPGDCCIIGSGKKNACAGPALPAVTARVAATTTAAP
jgi:hypothetical protein